MQKYKISISDPAKDDLESIGDHIAFRLLNPSAAENMVVGIRQLINKLTDFPKKHELDEDSMLASLGIRKTYYKEYKVFYFVDDIGQEVIVLRILHMRVDSKAVLYRMFGLQR